MENEFDIIWGRDIIEDNMILTDRIANADEIAYWQSQLDKHRSNWQMLWDSKTTYGSGETPLHLLNKIKAEEKSIKEVESRLAKLTSGNHKE